MKNPAIDDKSDQIQDVKVLAAKLAEPAPIGLWQRSQEKARDCLERAERRVTEGFRVPPGGG